MRHAAVLLLAAGLIAFGWSGNEAIAKKPVPTPAPTASSPGCQLVRGDHLSALRQAVLSQVNAARKRAKLRPLVLDACLNAAAQRHAKYMADSKDFNHTTASGVTMSQRLNAVGYKNWWQAENIAMGQPSAASVVKDWMASPGHRANIMNPKLKRLGVGYAKNYWVQDFSGR